MPEPAEPITFLALRAGDDVAVAVRNADPGEAPGAYLDNGTRLTIAVRAAFPLGHKVALRDLAAGEPVTEYGETIGQTRSAIAAGDHVHTHNLRSARWQHSL